MYTVRTPSVLLGSERGRFFDWHIMTPHSLGQNLIVNISALSASLGLSFMSVMQFLDGLLPTVSLLLTTITVTILLVYHTKNTKKLHIETQIREIELKKLLKELDQS